MENLLCCETASLPSTKIGNINGSQFFLCVSNVENEEIKQVCKGTVEQIRRVFGDN